MKSDNPFCNACTESDCLVSLDETCAMIRAYKKSTSDPAGYSSEVSEKGPWDVEEWSDAQVVIQSRDFTHDVALKVSGDFRSYAQKMAYAHEVCKRLNAWKDER